MDVEFMFCFKGSVSCLIFTRYKASWVRRGKACWKVSELSYILLVKLIISVYMRQNGNQIEIYQSNVCVWL